MMSVIRVIDEAERVPSRRLILIMLAMLCLGQAPNLRAQSVDALAQRLAHNRLEANELALDQRAGEISPQDYTDRALKNQQEFTRLEQVLGGLSPNAHAEVRSKATAIYNQGAAKLQAKQAQIQAAENRANIENRQQLLRQRAAGGPATQPPVPPVPGPTDSGTSPWHYAWLLVVPAAGTAGYFLRQRRRRYSQVPSPPPPGLSPAPRAIIPPPRSTAPPLPATAQPLSAGASPLPAGAPPLSATAPTPVSAAAGSPAPDVAATSAGGSARERMLGQVTARYQAGISAAMDALTETQMELQQHAAVPETIRQELLRIGGVIHSTSQELLRANVSRSGQALMDAVLLKPVFGWLMRQYRKGGVLIKLLLLWIAFMAVTSLLGREILTGLISLLPLTLTRLVALIMFGLRAGWPAYLVLYLIAVPVIFFMTRRSQTKGAMDALAKNAAAMKTPRLGYSFADQIPGVAAGTTTYLFMRISSAANQPLLEDGGALKDANNTHTVGEFLLWFDNLAVYRKPAGGSLSLLSMQPGNALMSNYAAIVSEAVDRHAAQFEPLCEAIARYGDVKWREHQQTADIARAEALLGNVAKLETIWRPVALADDVFDFLIPRIDLFNMRQNATPPGILLRGYPGNGKEYLTRKIAESVFAQFVKPSTEQLASAQRIKELWAAQAAHAPVVLFVEYADKVFARSGEQETAGREATLAWLEEWSRHEASKTGIWVVMSVQDDKQLHPRIFDHFATSRIEIKPPDAAGRALVMAAAARENQLPDAVPRAFSDSLGGTSVQKLRQIVGEVRMRSMTETATAAHWEAARKAVLGNDFGNEQNTWDRLVLPADIKAVLQRAARILREADRYKEKKVNVPNVLLFGPPGTGKTQVARTFANEGRVNFIGATTADLKGQYVGQSVQMVRDLFGRARSSAPCVLFIDEIESVAAKRGSPTADAFSADIVAEMLAQMDGVKANDRPVIVLAATNLPDQIDGAILDRFTSRIEIPLPDEAGRLDLLRRSLADKPRDPALDIEEISAYLAKRLKGRSGRELTKLIDRAMERAVSESDTPEDVKLTRAGILAEAFPQGKALPPEKLREIWDQIVLKPDVKAEILDKINLFTGADAAAPKGLLLFGPPGTGKTEIARRIADSAGCKFISLKVPDLKGAYLGQTAERVRKRWEEARAPGRCVMFIDECEGVFGRRGGLNTDQFAEELVQSFLAEWDGLGTEEQRIWIIGATNRRELLDEAIVSRFGTAIEIGLPGPEERRRIVQLELNKLGVTIGLPEFVGTATNGMAGRNLALLARELRALALKQGGGVTDANWRELIARFRRGGGAAVGEAGWETLILAPATIEKLKTVCLSLQNLESLRAQGVAVPKGAMLFGPPGTGKTEVARTLAKESGLSFLAATTAELKAGHLGQAGQKTRELFERARGMSPCILFIDEIDAVCPARGSPNSDQLTVEIVNQILQETEGVTATSQHVYVLGATNRLEAVDDAVRSRLGEAIEIPLPGVDERRRLLKVFLSKLKKVDFDVETMAAELAPRTKNLSGRALGSLVREASQRSVQRAYAAGTPENIVLTREDLLAQLQPQGEEVSAEKLREIWSQIVLKPELKADLIEKIRLFSRGDKTAPRGMLLFGPPGTGKTEIARRIADSAGCKFMSLKVPDLKGAYLGQTAERVRRRWEEARAAVRCVMFIDECEGVFGRRGGLNTDQFAEELVQSFLAEWDGLGTEEQRIWVIGATNRRELLDEAIVSRFGATYEIGLPGAAERAQILAFEMHKLERPFAIPEFAGAATSGMSGRNLAMLAKEVCMQAGKNGGAPSDALWRDTIKRLKTDGNTPTAPGASWGSLVLPEEVIDRLRGLCETLRNVEKYRERGFDVPSGALLYGPPGTGKTQIARTIANESGLPFIAATTADLKAGYIGQCGQKTRELFERARGSAPCILFIDEIDAVCPDRGGRSADQFTNEIVNQFLQEMDGIKASARHVFVLAATNLLEVIDEAVRSRFEEKIRIDYPDDGQRQRLFKQMLGKLPVDFDRDTVAAELAGMTQNSAGRDIFGIVKRASGRAVRRAGANVDAATLTRADLLSEVSSARPQ
jgi:SpoVK/Ycf46/Vps4 family AAA+-type ATPase